MKNRCYVADGEACQQAFAKFSDARNAAFHAPWANGLVYRHNVSFMMPVGYADTGKLCFAAPGAPFQYSED